MKWTSVRAAVNVAVAAMPDLEQIAGVVLAGGRSSRMGRNKALLDYNGRPLVQHMVNLLQDLGLKNIFISGRLDGYPCIEDDLSYAGPVQGIKSILKKQSGYKGYLFLPVDMPLLTAPMLEDLMAQENGGYFIEWPLPAYITPPFVHFSGSSVYGFLEAQGVFPVQLPLAYETAMRNINTPEEWEDVVRAI
jgi:molybdenum cofactor guanylyltransferase